LVYVSVREWPANGGAIVLVMPILLVGLAGLWRGRSLWVLIPAGLVWLGLVVVSLLATPPIVLTAATSAASVVVAIWAVVARAQDSRRQVSAAKQASNQLGWELYKLSTEPSITDESLPDISVYSGLRVGEVERHFDQVTAAAIQGGMQHAFRLKGTSTSVHGLPAEVLMFDTASWTRMTGSGISAVQLGMTGRTSDDLTDDAFVAVLERDQADGVDTIRAVVPSERNARAYVNQILMVWSAQLAPGSDRALMLRRYVGAITQTVTSDSSYVGDRLGAILRMPASERSSITVIGEPMNSHAVLVGAVRFGANGPLFQLFPVALVRALVALIDGRPLPAPLTGLPPAPSTTAESEKEEAQLERQAPASNRPRAGVRIRALGGLRILADGADVTSTLLDRKVLAFLWLHLLARKLRNPNDTITRASLADELSPGLDNSTQRSRLRGRLSELRNELPPALGRRVEVAGERIGLDLVGCQVDVVELLEAERTFGSSNGVLSAEQLKAVEAVVSDAKATFLPEWDDLEQRVNSGRGAAGEVVAELRHRVDAASATLLRVLGSGYLAHGKADAAVTALERALELSPDNESVARSLVVACLQTGRLSRAESLKRDFALV
jgi:DNA-binding SARP family transcriptional activator